MNTFDLRLDLDKGRTPGQVVRIRQGDNDGTTIRAALYDHGTALSGTVTACAIVMKLPDGTHYYRKGASWADGTATVTINEAQAASAVGRTALAYFQLTYGTDLLSTGAFAVIVEPDALADATVPESYDSAIQDAIDALDAAVEQMPDMVEDVLADHPEWTTTVQDGSITAPKLATDLARDRERLLYRLDNMLTATLPEGETATATDAAKTPVAGLALYGRSTQDGTPTPSAPVAIVSVEAANIVSEVKTGLFVNSGSGIIGISAGAQTAVARVKRNTDYTLAYDGGNRCIVAGVDSPNIASGDTARILFSSSSRVSPKTFNSGENDYVAMFVATSAAPASNIQLNAGSTAYPYVPYGNVGLWARGKNLLPFTAGTSTSNGVTFTVGEDGTITASGTSTGLATLHSTLKGRVLPAGTYTLSGCPSGGSSDSTYRIDLYQVGSSVAVAVDYGSGATFTIGEGMNVDHCRIRIPNGANVSGKVFWPMLRLASTGAEFVTYTATVTPVPLDGHELRSLPDGTRDEVTVDQYGHVTLVERVGHIELDGSSDEDWQALNKSFGVAAPNVKIAQASSQVIQTRSNRFVPISSDDTWIGRRVGVGIANVDNRPIRFHNGDMTLAEWKTWLASNPVTVDYPLATPQTIDLGTIDPVPLVGPDLTAQAVPTAPMQLTYERDLNATLARLESAIATLA